MKNGLLKIEFKSSPVANVFLVLTASATSQATSCQGSKTRAVSGSDGGSSEGGSASV